MLVKLLFKTMAYKLTMDASERLSTFFDIVPSDRMMAFFPDMISKKDNTKYVDITFSGSKTITQIYAKYKK